LPSQSLSIKDWSCSLSL